jgi:acylphosphatase
MADEKTVHLMAEGKVQGVFYRATAKEKADELTVKGWVKNTKEGKVEIIASGKEEDILAFINWCKKGPQRAEVINLQVSNLTYQSFPDFRIIK